MSKLENLLPSASVRGILHRLLGLRGRRPVVRFGRTGVSPTRIPPAASRATPSTATTNRASRSSSWAVRGASMATARSSGSCRRRTGSAWHTSSTRCSRSIHRSSIRSRTRSPPSTTRCCRGSRCSRRRASASNSPSSGVIEELANRDSKDFPHAGEGPDGQVLAPCFDALHVLERQACPLRESLLSPSLAGADLRDPSADVTDEPLGAGVTHRLRPSGEGMA